MLCYLMCNTCISDAPPVYLILWNKIQVASWIDEMLTASHYNETLVLETMELVVDDDKEKHVRISDFSFFHPYLASVFSWHSQLWNLCHTNHILASSFVDFLMGTHALQWMETFITNVTNMGGDISMVQFLMFFFQIGHTFIIFVASHTMRVSLMDHLYILIYLWFLVSIITLPTTSTWPTTTASCTTISFTMTLHLTLLNQFPYLLSQFTIFKKSL